MKRNIFMVTAFVLGLLSTSSMHAQSPSAPLASAKHPTTVTFRFSGPVTYVDPLLSSVASISDNITGTYTFDPTVPDTDPSDPSVGLYSSPTSSRASVGTFTAKSPPVIFNIFDNMLLSDGLTYRTQYRISLSQTLGIVNGLTYVGFTLDLWSNSTTPLSILSSDAFPATPPAINDFQCNQLRFYFQDVNGGVHYIIGTLKTLSAHH